MLLHGPSEKVLLAFKSESIPLIVTDPPYGISFMARDWDKHLPYGEIWAECYRVLKPGGFILVMASPRNDDLVSVSLREAGFIKHNSIYWVYGSGFPKGSSVSKLLDAQAVRDWLADKPHGLTAKEVRKVISAAVNGEYYDPQWGENNTDVGAVGLKGSKERRTAGAALIAQLESKYGEMPKRVKVGTATIGGGGTSGTDKMGDFTSQGDDTCRDGLPITAPATPLAAEWEGMKYGIQALKPAAEVILVFQKPFDGKPVDSIVRHGVGAVNVDAGRIGPTVDTRRANIKPNNWCPSGAKNFTTGSATQGRYPSNFLISHAPGCRVVGERRVKTLSGGIGVNKGTALWGQSKEFGGCGNIYADADGREAVKEYACVENCPVAELDRQSGERPTGDKICIEKPMGKDKGQLYGNYSGGNIKHCIGDTGTASRFFYQPEWSNADIPPFKYQAKASSRERNAGTENGCDHPTVKPVELFRYLIKLFIGKGRIVLDPFVGSGTTLIAGLLEGVKVIGIDAEKEYLEIAAARERHWAKNLSTYLTTGQIPVVKDAALPLFEED